MSESTPKHGYAPSQQISHRKRSVESWLDSTCAVHAGTHDDPGTGAVGTPIYQTSTFNLGAKQYAAVAGGTARDAFIYTRYGNPSQWAVQEKIAALEHAESALVFSSGMAAIAATVLTFCQPGGHIVASSELYGGSYAFLQTEVAGRGVRVSYVDPGDLGAIAAAVEPDTALLYFETLTNPLLRVLDVPRVAAIAARAGAKFVVDATFSTPMAMRPLQHGVDVVVHSCTKYLNGHSDLVAGAAAGSKALLDAIWPRLLAYGGSLDPHGCYLLERGLKTLAIRMQAHAASALAVAQFLQAHPKVAKVRYPGLPSHPDHALAAALMRNTGGMLAFEVGDDAKALRLLDGLRLVRQATSLGGVESLCSLPCNTSHAVYGEDGRRALGIMPGCVLLSVGIEDAQDIIADLGQALEAM